MLSNKTTTHDSYLKNSVVQSKLNTKINKPKLGCLSDNYSSSRPQQTTSSHSVYDADCRLINTDQLADIIGVKPETITKSRCTGLGDFPPYIRFNRTIRYRLQDVVDWVSRHTQAFGGELP